MGSINITGVSDSRSAAVLSKLVKQKGGSWIVVTADRASSARMASDLSFFVQKKLYLLPTDERVIIDYEARNRETMIAWLQVMRALAKGEDCMVIVPADGITKKLPPSEAFLRASFSITMGEDVDLQDTIRRLASLGYERVSTIYASGQFALRGDILDVYSPYEELPTRIELFDTEVESIRSFDLTTQRSVAKCETFEIAPASILMNEEEAFSHAAKTVKKQYARYPKRREELLEAIENRMNLQGLETYMDLFYDDSAYLWDYLPENGHAAIEDPNRCWETLESRKNLFAADAELYLEKETLCKKDLKQFVFEDALKTMYEDCDEKGIWFFSMFPRTIHGVQSLEDLVNVQTRQVLAYNGRMDLFKNEVSRYVNEAYKVYLVCKNEDRVQSLEDFLDREGLRKRVWVQAGTLSSGMEFVDEKVVYITDSDIFGSQKRKSSRKKVSSKNASPIKSFADIHEGDFVVHETYGIGRYLGLEKLTVAGETKDFLKVQYAGEDMLYVPAEQMDLIQKYIGANARAPKINKLSGTDWRATKAKARASVAEMANELLEISAARSQAGGYAFGEDTVWQKDFEDAFPYEETSDQLRAVEEIKKDMETPIAMDRLLCGDVGYGKTEVAARAIFKCAEDGKQVAFLVPTTILASQHYHTLKERFAEFPFELDSLSRFRSPAEQKITLEKLATGGVDVVVGTHRLLSKDVRFKNLGLLVIDEEQRFGVADKEKIKKMKNNVDVLTLSATPIPRTLHMSLLGIRNMSLLEEPPLGRFPVQTYVMEEDETVIRDVILRELDRGGQVFVIHNRVREIPRITAKIEELVPQATVVSAHGRMNEHQVEDVMMQFVDGEADVLVATTIIENGIDVPNANTVLVLDADRFGLSQLYQIRGRVGRSSRIAYAYLLHRKGKVLTEVAEKRLRAIKDFTEFGAGFKIAMRDLEIRGAGNLLGSEQHGHMVNVGYELYCRMVDDAVRALKGERVVEEHEEITLDIRLTAYIPDSYIEDRSTKLEMYRRIAEVENEEDREDVQKELEDRFGKIPVETRNLILLSLIRTHAEKLQVSRLSLEGSDGKTLLLVFKEGITPRSQKLYLKSRGDHLREIIEILELMEKVRSAKEAEVEQQEPSKTQTMALPEAKTAGKPAATPQVKETKPSKTPSKAGGRYANVNFSGKKRKPQPPKKPSPFAKWEKKR